MHGTVAPEKRGIFIYMFRHMEIYFWVGVDTLASSAAARRVEISLRQAHVARPGVSEVSAPYKSCYIANRQRAGNSVLLK